jgi:hypothetical protein
MYWSELELYRVLTYDIRTHSQELSSCNGELYTSSVQEKSDRCSDILAAVHAQIIILLQQQPT